MTKSWLVDFLTNFIPPSPHFQRYNHPQRGISPKGTTMQTDLKLSGNAVNRINELLAAKDNPDLKLRVFIRGGGCSGFQYGFQFDQERQEDDIAIEQSGVEVLVDMLSLQYLSGAEIDYQDDLLGSRFLVNNPNASTTCGCGSSFSI